jgi:regulator of sigma E protease
MDFMQILVFLAILSLVVLIHELGHFAAARFFGIKVEEFGFGFPPRMIRLFRKGETDYTINWLPIGGFVKIYGENGEGQGVKDERAFWSKPGWQRAAVLSAGVVMNFLLGVVLFGAVYSVLGVPAKIEGVKIVSVADGSPAAAAGMQEGDVVKKIVIPDKKDEIEGEITVLSAKLFVETVNKNKGGQVDLIVDRDGEVLEMVMTPRENPPEGEGSIGVAISESELRKYPWWQMPFRGMWVGLKEALAWGREILVGMGSMVWGLVSGKGLPRGMAGPVGIYEISNEVRKAGILPLLQFVGVLSVNLAILNIMPFPALDGGRLVFLGIEAIRGKKMREDIEGIVNTVGMVLILGLMVVITGNDSVRILGGWEAIAGKVMFFK